MLELLNKNYCLKSSVRIMNFGKAVAQRVLQVPLYLILRYILRGLGNHNRKDDLHQDIAEMFSLLRTSGSY
jgi:hypothetical protein